MIEPVLFYLGDDELFGKASAAAARSVPLSYQAVSLNRAGEIASPGAPCIFVAEADAVERLSRGGESVPSAEGLAMKVLAVADEQAAVPLGCGLAVLYCLLRMVELMRQEPKAGP